MSMIPTLVEVVYNDNTVDIEVEKPVTVVDVIVSSLPVAIIEVDKPVAIVDVIVSSLPVAIVDIRVDKPVAIVDVSVSSLPVAIVEVGILSGPKGDNGTLVVAVPYDDWPPADPQDNTLYLRLAP